MARKKQYNEQEVIEKATALFWRNGYEATTVRMLEKEMGINQFSIYSSFGNKQGVFLKSIDDYKKKVRAITDKLQQSKNGKEGIKQYFYDFLEFAKEDEKNRGCLVTNTVNEIKDDSDPIIKTELVAFADNIKQLFINNLIQDEGKSPKQIEGQANYLMNSLLGLSVSSKVFDQEQIKDIIEFTFVNL
ncbi:TetR/AcrR family transcriptional regulator [Zobellia alginiliquefaciens]|uniref:TetR/AcrR family transcriptional regulator n=1 Tax=Zobellia alginiliquefaciens TaxID=3032586 RepID=UPI0023E3B154|nr:TetR/AcrR family transcriptional regulator [Zobellia alginiliquefaciens]